MAQTTGAITGAAAAVYLKVASGSLTDYSGQSQSVDAVTATRINSEAYTFDGSNAIILVGKEEPVEVTVNFLYTEVALELWEVAEAAFQAASTVYPAVDASSSGPVVASITVRAPGISYAA